MYTLFFDTETCGVPKNYSAPPSEVSNWPRLVQLGWTVYDGLECIKQYEFIIKPDGFEIPVQASSVHGITTERAMLEGVSVAYVLVLFKDAVENCDLVIGHNVNFDLGVVGAEFYRLFGKNPLEGKPSVCTMKSSVEHCAIPSPYKVGQFKWPKLEELYSKLFGHSYGQTHTALDDIKHTAECYFALVERGVIKPIENTEFSQ